MPASPSPVSTTDRLGHVDTLRGFALGGVLAANLMLYSGYVYMSDEQKAALSTARADRVVEFLESVFVENKFLGLFAALFGAGFWLFLSNKQDRQGGGAGLFLRRLFWLVVIGAAHGDGFWCFDVLRFYALWGLCLMPLRRASPRATLAAGLCFAVLAPAAVLAVRAALEARGVRTRWDLPEAAALPGAMLDAEAFRTFSTRGFRDTLRVNWLYDWRLTLSVGQIGYQMAIFGRLALGLWAVRAISVARLRERRRRLTPLLIAATCAGVGLNVFTALRGGEAQPAWAPAAAQRLADEAGYLLLTACYAAWVVLFLPRGALRRGLASLGRTALTCYLAHTAIGLWLFYAWPRGPALMGRLGPAWLAAVWAGVYGAQAVIATLWLRRFRFGPAEWAWRSLTYWRAQPLRVAAPPTKAA